MKSLNLTDGNTVFVDEQDFDLVDQYRWYTMYFGTLSYACSTTKTLETGIQELIHRLILRPASGLEVDHIDGDGLNNIRSNLRICTSSQNKGNQRKSVNKSSEYKGVSWDTSRQKWIVHIHKHNKQVFLGRFDDKQLAAKAYDDAAKEYFGEFARTNF